MDPIELSALGATGSAVLAALAYWAKTNHERRRVTRTVLYHLLEMHHVVNRVRVAVGELEHVLLFELRRALQARGLTFNEQDGQAAMRLSIPYLAKFAFSEVEGTMANGAQAFDKALSDLARENPVLAFHLRGRDKVAVMGGRLKDFVQSASVQSGPRAPSEQEFAHFNQVFLKLSIEELQRAIRATSWGCDVITHFKVLRLLRHARNEKSSEDLTGVIRHLVEEYVSTAVPTNAVPT